MTQVKGSKKKFFEIKIPLTTTKVHLIGHTAEELEGKVIKLDLTKNLRGKSMELRARVKLQNKELESTIISLELLPNYVRRVIRKGIDYVEDSFETDSRDAKLRIKPFLLTRQRVSRSVRKELRETTKKHLENHIKSRSTEEIFSEVMSNKMQKDLSLKLKKIYPLALCEIRHIELVPEKKVLEA